MKGLEKFYKAPLDLFGLNTEALTFYGYIYEVPSAKSRSQNAKIDQSGHTKTRFGNFQTPRLAELEIPACNGSSWRF